jgi:hypothetical protein
MLAPWTKSDWTHEELHKASVQFRLVGPVWTVSGIGQFRVGGTDKARLRIDIVVEQPGAHWSQINQTNFHLGQDCVSNIRRHPDQEKAKFLVECGSTGV